jgi:hypothetical protein
MAVHTEEFGRRLRWRGAGDPMRSARASDSVAVGAVGNVDAIAAAMDLPRCPSRPKGWPAANGTASTSWRPQRAAPPHPPDPAGLLRLRSDVGLYGHPAAAAAPTPVNRHAHPSPDNVIRSQGASNGSQEATREDLTSTAPWSSPTPSSAAPRSGRRGSGRNHHPYGT